MAPSGDTADRVSTWIIDFIETFSSKINNNYNVEYRLVHKVEAERGASRAYGCTSMYSYAVKKIPVIFGSDSFVWETQNLITNEGGYECQMGAIKALEDDFAARTSGYVKLSVNSFDFSNKVSLKISKFSNFKSFKF